MFRKLFFTAISILAVGSLSLAACSFAQPTAKEPTVDANAIYTQAAQTVEAQMNANPQSKPTATSTVAPTDTPEPSATPAQVDATAVPGSTIDNSPTATNTPVVNILASPTTAAGSAGQPASSGNKCDWVSQSPTDGTKISKNSSWDMTIVVKNTGTTTWTKAYALKFWGGDKMGSPTDFYLQNDVKPGDMYRFVFSMTAPDSTGKKQANWIIQTGDGLNFCPVFLQVEITG